MGLREGGECMSLIQVQFTHVYWSQLRVSREIGPCLPNWVEELRKYIEKILLSSAIIWRDVFWFKKIVLKKGKMLKNTKIERILEYSCFHFAVDLRVFRSFFLEMGTVLNWCDILKIGYEIIA